MFMQSFEVLIQRQSTYFYMFCVIMKASRCQSTQQLKVSCQICDDVAAIVVQIFTFFYLYTVKILSVLLKRLTSALKHEIVDQFW